ncbi:hypothetical protein DNTS_033932 [Danionella cerebrum]|uniref:Transducer of regulated CREB activity N-terminal domain-containing protein n=1 Tax=Danionella cerebrum TaxID=2873325 RepID=A0A553N0K5_9TELE|nr:hypothetical protein DNTS_033932 [Danionella translucida]
MQTNCSVFELQGNMASSNNPRKFSEKIALHNQKQAEETAAFEEVMKDLSITRAARLQLQKTQYLQLGQNRGPCYGGSLPNVNQIGNAGVDLPFQTPFQNSGLDTNRTTRHHGLVDRVYRDRTRITSPHRRPLSVDKHGRQISFIMQFSELHGLYLSPPPDTSWRRTNSDSALHQSTLNPNTQDLFAGGSQELQPKQGKLTKAQVKQNSWNKEITASLIPVAHNTGGSLPDLTNIQIPPPLPTPLDPEDSSSSLSASNSSGNLTTGAKSAQPSVTMSLQRRHENVIPLTLNTDTSQLPNLQQLSPTLSPPLSLSQAVIDTMTLEQALAQYAFFSQPSLQTQGASLQQNSQLPAVSGSHTQTSVGIDINTAASLQQYRCRVGSSANQSPTSPVSNQGFSPGGSPQHSSILGSVFADAFYDQQLSPRQTSTLSQQLEQFNMIENPISSSSLFSDNSTLNYSHAAMLNLTGSHGNLQDASQLGYGNHGNIPNIILTGDVSFDADSQFPLDELKIDPLTLDGLHMLNDPDMVLTDSATEDAFRMDRL